MKFLQALRVVTEQIRISYTYQAFPRIWQTSVNSVFLRNEVIQIWQIVLDRDDWQTFLGRVKTFHLMCSKKWRFCFRTTIILNILGDARI